MVYPQADESALRLTKQVCTGAILALLTWYVAYHASLARHTGKFKRVWTKKEDEQLVALVSRLGACNWSVLALNLPGRCGKQCRERWFNHLSPNVRTE